MANRNRNQQTHSLQLGVDDKVWKGVLTGLNAMRYRNKSGSKTVSLDIQRDGQRLFVLPTTLTEDEAKVAQVVLNGVLCMDGRDYRITTNNRSTFGLIVTPRPSVLNWIAGRGLLKSDAVAIRYNKFVPVVSTPIYAQAATALGIADHKVAIDTMGAQLTTTTKKLNERLAEIEVYAESIGKDVDIVTAEVADIGETLDNLEQEPAAETAREEEMIEPGAKVWHRLTGEGPWIVVQPTVLSINSRQEGGEENRFNKSFVEVAWTVQTEEALKDLPEVVLTTRPPKSESMSWTKKIALGLSGIGITAAIVHAPLLAKLLGLVQ